MSPSSPYEIQLVKINGKSFVSGLMWQPLTKPRNYMSEAREIGKRDSMDIVAIRLGLSMIQAGFVKKGNGVTKGMYSLASALAGHIKHESWIGAFALPNGLFALVAVHGGLIVPGCDVVGDKDTIRNLLLEKDSQPKILKFDMVYHPDSFEYRGEALDIEDLLVPQSLRKEYALKQLTWGLTKRELIICGCAGVIVIAGVVGYMQWSAYEKKKIARAAYMLEQKRLQELAALNAKAGAEQPVQALLHPWATMPGIEDFVNGCEGAINALPLAIGGWTFESAFCNSSTTESVYARSGKTTFNDFVEATKDRFPSPPVLMDGAERAGLGDQISLGAGGDDELLPYEAVQADFTSYLQKQDLKAEITEVPVVVPKAPAALPGENKEAPTAPPPPNWKHFTFTLVSQQPPKAVFSGLRISGIRLVDTSVVRSETLLTWTTHGEIYAR